MLEVDIPGMRKIFPYLEPSTFIALGEWLIFQPSTAAVTGAFIFAVFEALRFKRNWWHGMMVFATAAIAFTTLLWSQWVSGQVFLALGLAAVLVLTGRWSPRKISPPTLLDACILAYLFLVFLNFYLFQSQTPFSYGIIYAVAILLVFLGLRQILPAGFGAWIAALLVSEFIFALHFLPFGYITLSVTSLIAAYAAVILLRQRNSAGRQLALELAAMTALILAIFAVSGIRPR